MYKSSVAFIRRSLALVKIDQIATESCSRVIAVAHSYGVFRKNVLGGRATLAEGPRRTFEERSMMSPETGPNRLNMKFSESGRKVVIHLVRGLPPKISQDKKTITITFADPFPARSKSSKLKP